MMITNPLTTNIPAPNATMRSSNASPSAPTSPNQAAQNTENVFLQLLVTELQSQDPTSPMDATTMVGQMLSMNQLNELIAINQTLQSALPASTQASSSSSATQSTSGAH